MYSKYMGVSHPCTRIFLASHELSTIVTSILMSFSSLFNTQMFFQHGIFTGWTFTSSWIGHVLLTRAICRPVQCTGMWRCALKSEQRDLIRRDFFRQTWVHIGSPPGLAKFPPWWRQTLVSLTNFVGAATNGYWQLLFINVGWTLAGIMHLTSIRSETVTVPGVFFLVHWPRVQWSGPMCLMIGRLLDFCSGPVHG